MQSWVHDLVTITAPVVITLGGGLFALVRRVDRLHWEIRETRKDQRATTATVASLARNLALHERDRHAHGRM